jgi:DNA methyltransferase 1-associated protein 1
MGDVAEILGLQGKQAQSNGEVAAKILSEKPKAAGPKGVKKPKGMSREVFDLMGPGQDSLLPSMQTNATMTSAAFKSRRTTAAKGRWVWATFTNSARANDENSKIFYHWVKSDVQSSDYPYAKFNIKLDPVMYSEDEYEHLLKAEQWSRAETDHLMYICYKYDLRWPVIADRYALIPAKRTEEMQARYYSIVAKVRAHRSGTGESSLKNEPYTSFDYDAERTRREQQEILFRKTREDEAEEMRLREELKFLDAQLKAKKAVKNTESRAAQKAAQENKLAHAQAQAHALNAVAVLTVQSDHMAAPGRPALQSTRLQNTEQSTTLSRTLLKKMTALLKELGVPEAPLPTRAVCDYYDNVRRDCITLLSLHSAIQKKERDILAMKAQYNDWQMGSKGKTKSENRGLFGYIINYD